MRCLACFERKTAIPVLDFREVEWVCLHCEQRREQARDRIRDAVERAAGEVQQHQRKDG